MMDKKVVNKSTSLVHIKANRQLTLIERKLSNVLLRNAQCDFFKKDEYKIKVSDLLSELGWESSKNITDLKVALGGLVDTKIEFDVFEKEAKKIQYMGAILAEAEIKHGTCWYSYPVRLKGYIVNLNLYARIDLEVSRRFRNRDAHTLWEFLVECLSTKNVNETVATPWITIEDFLEKILNKKNTNMELKRINHRFIKKSIAEINKLSNIRVVDTEIEKKKDGVYVRFMIEWSNLDSPVMDVVDADKVRVESMIRQYSEIKATKSPVAYANVIKKSLANGETTMEAIQEFLDKYNAQKLKKETVLNAQCDELNDQEELLNQWHSLPVGEQKKLEQQAIDELKRLGLKNIEKNSIPNKKIIKEKVLEIMENKIV
jgi:hypothetical protein